MVNIIFDDQVNKEIIVNNEEIITRAINIALDVMEVGEEIEVSVSLVNDSTIKDLNRDYRGVDKVTDVLSFPMDFGTDLDLPILMLGDVVINLDKVKDQALEFGHSEERELSYLTVHSILHLLGYDHIEDEDRLLMREKEKEIMKELGVLKWKEIMARALFFL